MDAGCSGSTTRLSDMRATGGSTTGHELSITSGLVCIMVVMRRECMATAIPRFESNCHCVHSYPLGNYFQAGNSLLYPC